MADALSRALSAGVSLAEIQRMQAEGLPLEEIAAAAERVQDAGEDEIVEDVRPGDFSDAGNMDKFLELNEGRLLFTDSRGWLYWNGVRWVEDDHKATKNAVKMSVKMLEDAQSVYRAALHALADAKAEGDREEMDQAAAAVKREKAYLDHAMRTRSDRRIKAILELAKHFLAVDPAKLDANPAELNTPKAIINLKTGETKTMDFPTTSDVLQFFLADGCKISVRPSGTEPKIKFYFEARATMKNVNDFHKAQAEALAKIDAMMADLKIN